MRKICFLLSLFLLTLLILSLNADEVDVTGDWELIVETRRGEMTMRVNFVQKGEELTATIRGQRGREFTGEGSVKGDEIEWTVTRSTRRGEMTSTYKGKVSGDEMSGEVQRGNFGSFKWRATRIEEE